jgi:hypothetical protein
MRDGYIVGWPVPQMPPAKQTNPEAPPCEADHSAPDVGGHSIALTRFGKSSFACSNPSGQYQAKETDPSFHVISYRFT